MMALLPASMAGLPASREYVNVGPPLLASGPKLGLTPTRSPFVPLTNNPPPLPIRLLPESVTVFPEPTSVVFPKMMEFPIVRLVFSIPKLPPLIVESYKLTIPPLIATVFPLKVLLVAVALMPTSPAPPPEIVLSSSETDALEEPEIASVAFARVRLENTSEAEPVTSKIVPEALPLIAMPEPLMVKLVPMSSGLLSEITPETRNAMVSPLLAAAISALRLPEPESNRLVTVRVLAASGSVAASANSVRPESFKNPPKSNASFTKCRSYHSRSAVFSRGCSRSEPEQCTIANHPRQNPQHRVY